MRQLFKVFYIGVLLFAFTASAIANESEEIQVLIDVSGSMKQNDPKNLRTEATQLLISLLPDKAKVALWLFAEQTTLLSRSDAVDDTWRQQALKESKAIHSRGLYTDIEKAIDTVLKNEFTGEGDKYLILLTDGMVDISKDIMVSADSRERILSDWIPRLRQRRIKVETVALSEQADKELLEKLAFETDGWSENAESAELLQRMFLKMMQKVAPKDTVPLDGNRFRIDGSIQEFSVLVFKKPGASPTQLVSPDQQTISKQQAIADNIAWLETSGYDLITVKQPMPGDWQIAAEIDPDNQVMILTDLKLQLEGLSQFIGEKDQPSLKLYFTERDALIDRKDFLDLVTLSLAIDRQQAAGISASKNQPGFFVTSIKDLGIGKHSLSFIADGKTFKREIVRDIEVISSPIRVEKLVDAVSRQVTLKFLPDSEVIDNNSLSISAEMRQSEKAPHTQAVSEQNGEWLLPLPSLPPGSTLSVHFLVEAKTRDGNVINPALAPITIDDNLFSSAQVSGEQKATPPTEETAKPEASTTEQQAQSEEAEVNWGWTIAIVILANILLGGIGIFTYKMLKTSAIKKQQQLMGRLE